MICGFLISGEYAITRPTSNALFLSFFSAKGYPWAWLAIVPINLLAIDLYNRFLPKIGPLRVLLVVASFTICINTFAALFSSQAPLLIFFQYSWKEIYILLMFKQLWSMIHSTIPATRAKYLYGCIYGMGTVGAIIGSLVPSIFAVNLGSERILFFTLPVYFLLILAYSSAFKRSGVEKCFSQLLTTDPRPREAYSLIRKSSTLIVALLLVVFMQVVTGLMEYRFNANLELNILDKDLRTAYCGSLGTIIGGASLVLQFLGTFVFIRLLGVKKGHLLIPLLLLFLTLITLIFPTFGILTLSYAFLKAIDFSIFGVIREMLYVPLKLDEKFRAKAVIDVFAYRSSKALVSLALLILPAFAGIYFLQLTTLISVFILTLWFVVVYLYFRRSEDLQKA